MIIKTLVMGPLEVNNYLLICEETGIAAIIDAGGDYFATMSAVKENNADLKYLFHTHGHYDHLMGSYDLKIKAGLEVYLHWEDKFLTDIFKSQLAMYGITNVEVPVIDKFVEDEQELEIGKLKLKVIHTPGHSPGGVCYLVDNALFSGDTLFQESVGRTDLPGGSYETLRNSITNKLFILKDSTIVYPGHGASSTIGHEKEHNPFFGKNNRQSPYI